MSSTPLITIAVPSYNQGQYLDAALESIFEQGILTEVFVADGGSQDESIDILRKWDHRLAGWVSTPDDGQAAAINWAVAKGSAPYVCWLNSDDLLLAGGLRKLLAALEIHSNAPFAYGRVFRANHDLSQSKEIFTYPFSPRLMANLCIVSQPGTLIRRTAWEAGNGLDTRLQMTMDYDLWWRLFKHFGSPLYVSDFVAIDRNHSATKTNTRRRDHYIEAMSVVKRHFGRIPLKWYVAWPYAVWYRSLRWRLRSSK